MPAVPVIDRSDNAPHPRYDLPRVVLATTVVVVVPVVASLMLRVYQVVSSPWMSMVLAGLLSLAASFAGAWYWRRRRGGGPLLFSDMLIWGWLRRWRQERKLADAIKTLGLDNADGAGPEQWLSAARAERVLSQLVDALESQDVCLRGHSRRVARHAGMIAEQMRLPAEEVDRVRAAAVVHDVGKLRTPRQIVDKPSRLTDAEFELIKLHPVVGAEMAAALADPGLTAIVRHHHERVDGTGYPDGLKGDQIPLGARIIAVADTFDAVTSTRPYRGAARHQRAIEILRQASGSQLDPAAVRAFLAYYSGHRLAVAWAMACATPRRIIGWFNGEAIAAPTSSGKLAAAVVMSIAVTSSVTVAPIAAVNASGLLAAAPGISANPGASTNVAGVRELVALTGSGSRAPLDARLRDGEHGESSSPARRLTAAFAAANSPAAQTPAVVIGNPAAREATDPVGESPAGGSGTTSALSARTSLAVPPTPTPASTIAPTSQASSTVSAATAQIPTTTAPPSRPSHPQPRGHAGPGSGSPSGSANGNADAHGRTNAGPTSPSGGPPGNAYGHDTGGPGNPNAQDNPGDQGNQGGQGDAGGQANGIGQGNTTGQANASGHATGAPQDSAGAQGKAYGHTHAGS
jgi:putative nucleotidyltransferase with HDIG domain